jgi:hypothetical protein
MKGAAKKSATFFTTFTDAQAVLTPRSPARAPSHLTAATVSTIVAMTAHSLLVCLL